MLFQIPAQVDNVRTLKDGSFRITFETQEIPNPEEVAKLFELKKQGLGWVLFKAATITPEDIPAYDPATFDEIKSPSRRLRAVMFVVWKEVKGSNGDFESFYRAQVERIIEQYKEKLPS